MNKLCCLLILVGVVASTSCKKQQQEETVPEVVAQFAEDLPLAIEVTKVRSYYHALNIRDRLHGLGMKPYVVASQDTLEGGKWYSILVGAKKDSAELSQLKSELQSNYKLDSLKVVDYGRINQDLIPIATEDLKAREQKQIDAEKPGVPEKFFGVIGKFPNSNMFFVERMYVFGAPENENESSDYSYVRNVELDLPRGITAGRLLDLATCFAEVVYKDNIYGDKVTMDVVGLRPDHGLSNGAVDSASVLARAHASQLAIAGHFADLILNTGEYATEEKTEISVPAFNNLSGYRTVIEPRSGYFRTYLVLVDSAAEYAVFCQSTDRSLEDLTAVLTLVGKGDGMMEYDEFHNTFFTLPATLDKDDIFIGFYIQRLDWSYAKEKGYKPWAKECVGHWSAQGLFYNRQKGLWSYGIYDLLTQEKVTHAGQLYSKDASEGKEAVKVYGQDGFFVQQQYLDYEDWNYYWRPQEVNFTIGRYICMVDNIGRTRLNREELIAKAEAFQFQRGGYQVAQADLDSTKLD